MLAFPINVFRGYRNGILAWKVWIQDRVQIFNFENYVHIRIKKLHKEEHVEVILLLNNDQDQLNANREDCSKHCLTVPSAENSHDDICKGNFNCFSVISQYSQVNNKVILNCASVIRNSLERFLFQTDLKCQLRT